MGRHIAVGLAFMLVACATTSTPGSEATQKMPGTFRATLDAAHEVPPPNVGSATPSGTATFTVEGSSMTYALAATGLTSQALAAHIHSGAPGTAGPVLVPLAVKAGPTPGTASGEGTFDASAIRGKNADGSPMTLNDLLTALRSGGTYVNIHTANNKSGEIRGQISMKP